MNYLLIFVILLFTFSCVNKKTNQKNTTSIGCIDIKFGTDQGCSYSIVGNVTTLTGQKNTSGYIDGSKSLATLNGPSLITTDGTYIYSADFGESKIRKINSTTGEVSTLSFTFSNISTITASKEKLYVVDGSDLYVSNVSNYSFSLLASNVGDLIHSMIVYGDNIYGVDTLKHVIKKINVNTGVVSVYAGTLGVTGLVDGIGTSARLDTPEVITSDGTYFYIGDGNNNCIRKINISTGEVTTPTWTKNTNHSYGVIDSLVSDGSQLYLEYDNKLFRLNPNTGQETLLAGSGTADSINGSGAAASFNGAWALLTLNKKLYIAEPGGNLIRVIE